MSIIKQYYASGGSPTQILDINSNNNTNISTVSSSSSASTQNSKERYDDSNFYNSFFTTRTTDKNDKINNKKYEQECNANKQQVTDTTINEQQQQQQQNILLYNNSNNNNQDNNNTNISNCLNQKHEQLFTTKQMRDYTIANHVNRNDHTDTSEQMLFHHHQNYTGTNFINPHSNTYQNYFSQHNSGTATHHLTQHVAPATRYHHLQQHQHDMYSDLNSHRGLLNTSQIQLEHHLINAPSTSVTSSTPTIPSLASFNHQISYSDYILKYEKPDENGYTIMNQNDEDCTDTNPHHSYNTTPYITPTVSTDTNLQKDKTSYMKPNSMIDSYGNSVYDSPLSLTTTNDDMSTTSTLMTTLTTPTQRDAYHNRLANNSNILLRSSTTGSVATTTTPTHDKHLEVLKANKTVSPQNIDSSNITQQQAYAKQINTDATPSSSSNCSTSSSGSGSSSFTKTPNSKSTSSLNDYELITLPLRELNKRLRYMPKPAAIDLKRRRRTLKNRKYAQNCRSKRLEQKCDIELQNIRLKSEINRLQKIIDAANKEKCLYKAYIDQLTKSDQQLKLNNIKIDSVDNNNHNNSHANFYQDISSSSTTTTKPSSTTAAVLSATQDLNNY